MSIQLRKLEEYLGVTLFERARAHVAITADGQRVLRLARVTVRAADRIVTVSRNSRKGVVAESLPVAEALIEEINCEVGPRCKSKPASRAEKQGIAAWDRRLKPCSCWRARAFWPVLLKTLRDVVEHYNNGGVTDKADPVTIS